LKGFGQDPEVMVYTFKRIEGEKYKFLLTGWSQVIEIGSIINVNWGYYPIVQVESLKKRDSKGVFATVECSNCGGHGKIHSIRDNKFISCGVCIGTGQMPILDKKNIGTHFEAVCSCDPTQLQDAIKRAEAQAEEERKAAQG